MGWPVRLAPLSPGWHAHKSHHVAVHSAESILQPATYKHNRIIAKSFVVRTLLSWIFHLPSEAARSNLPPSSEEQLACLHSKSIPTIPPADPPADDPPPSNGTSDNSKLNIHGSIATIRYLIPQLAAQPAGINVGLAYATPIYLII